MKKILLVMMILFLLCGCTDMMNTPTKRVEEFFSKYKTMDDTVLTQLDSIMASDDSMTTMQKQEYKEIIKKQYQELSYKIKNETIDGNTATVEAEVEVYDYATILKTADTYVLNNPNEFISDIPDSKNIDNTDETNDMTDTITDNIGKEKIMDYKIKQLKTAKDRIKYTINFTLTKQEKKWVLDNITETERQKIHGLYNY